MDLKLEGRGPGRMIRQTTVDAAAAETPSAITTATANLAMSLSYIAAKYKQQAAQVVGDSDQLCVRPKHLEINISCSSLGIESAKCMLAEVAAFYEQATHMHVAHQTAGTCATR